jgi:hypothetical protein
MPASTIQHAVTAADVKAIYAKELANSKTPAQAYHGTRTQVKALIQEDNQTPLPLDPPSRVFNISGIVVKGGVRVHDPALAESETRARSLDVATRKAALHARVSEDDILESERARSGADGTHRDAVHFVQKRHGIALWTETDRLVRIALGGPPA